MYFTLWRVGNYDVDIYNPHNFLCISLEDKMREGVRKKITGIVDVKPVSRLCARMQYTLHDRFR